ncbi:carboxymuconolactone decarboxylase family protein [Thermopolyspora sp. NPDC052614]|uniref:carboxymuconolactone decarboxylase family protein n=1 Tax=Thermopolyspora sp. NPDC052614 TaxID=3155682 RepID=UPI003432BEE5
MSGRATRLERFEVADLDAAQRKIYDRIVGGRRVGKPQPYPLVDERGRLEGPTNAWLLSPPVGEAFELLGAAIRFDLSISHRIREIVTFLVAAHRDSPYEKYAHRLTAPLAGMTAEEIEELCAGRDPGLTDESERVAFEVARTLIESGDLDDATYERAVALLGARGLFEITVLIGYYEMTATQLAVFGVLPPDNAG